MMSTINLTLDLVGAIALGYMIGYLYSKSKSIQKFKNENKFLRDSLNNKDNDLISIKQNLRDEHRKVIHLEEQLLKSERVLKKKTNQYNNLKKAISIYKNNLKDKKEQIKELETLLLEIQDDYAILQNNMSKETLLNKQLKDEFEQKISKLTQKANDLFMIKGTEELKSAKKVFDSLREESLKKLKG